MKIEKRSSDINIGRTVMWKVLFFIFKLMNWEDVRFFSCSCINIITVLVHVLNRVRKCISWKLMVHVSNSFCCGNCKEQSVTGRWDVSVCMCVSCQFWVQRFKRHKEAHIFITVFSLLTSLFASAQLHTSSVLNYDTVCAKKENKCMLHTFTYIQFFHFTSISI